ncbi:MAG: beta-hexosaminidase, partial [Firmicutes bacterium]|nr:beta-hexosaminidase [Bacillota bacterium]
TSRYIRQVVRTMNQQNVGSVLKHFPGYGGNSDTHQGFSVDTRPYSQFLASDLRPFQAGIQSGAGCVLVSHNIVECMDDEKPASLSREVHRLLREELGFDGVIMTDDLVMEAITDAYGAAEAAILAVKAGNDMLCCTDYKTQIPAVIAAAESGKISEDQINESVLRVLLWKHALGLMETGPEEEETT